VSTPCCFAISVEPLPDFGSSGGSFFLSFGQDAPDGKVFLFLPSSLFPARVCSRLITAGALFFPQKLTAGRKAALLADTFGLLLPFSPWFSFPGLPGSLVFRAVATPLVKSEFPLDVDP